MAAAPGGRLRWSLWAAGCLALFVLGQGFFQDRSPDLQLLEHALGRSVPGDIYAESAGCGPYLLSTKAVAAALGALGLADLWLWAVAVLRLVFFLVGQVALRRLLRRLCGDDEAAVIGTLLFAAGASLVPLGTAAILNGRLNHLLAVPAVLWSLESFLAGARTRAYVIAGAAVLLNANPAIYLLALIVVEDAALALAAGGGRELRAALLRAAGMAAYCAGLMSWFRSAGSDDPGPLAFLASVRYQSPQISLLEGANRGDVVFALAGAAWLAAFGGFGRLRHGASLARMTGVVLLGCVVSSIFEAFPGEVRSSGLWAIAVRVDWLKSLWYLNLFGLAAAARWLWTWCEEDRPFVVAAASGAGLFLSSSYDVLTRMGAALLTAFGSRLPAALPWAALGGAAAFSAVWSAAPERFAALARAVLPIRGGLFASLMFTPACAAAAAAAAAAGWAGSRPWGKAWRPELLGLVAAACALALRAGGWGPRPPAPEWTAALAYARSTPEGSRWFIPLSMDQSVFTAEARRPVYAAATFYDVIHACTGLSGVHARRLTGMGVDFARSGSYEETLAERDRADRQLDAPRLLRSVDDVSSAFALRPAGAPLAGLDESYRNAAFVIYRVK
ncbi:MAG: hypothetical protein HYZ75_00405 [Elusimicrobia bacterium]|nr:hypothetical protein [Elusimicrobiota bacterium]